MYCMAPTACTRLVVCTAWLLLHVHVVENSLLYLVMGAPLLLAGSMNLTVRERLDVTWSVTSVGASGRSVREKGVSE